MRLDMITSEQMTIDWEEAPGRDLHHARFKGEEPAKEAGES